MSEASAVLRLALDGRAITVTPREAGDYVWRVDDPATSDWMKGHAPDALAALRAAAAAAGRLPTTQRAVRGSGEDDLEMSHS